ncbi:nucleotidyltransferase family protein [bacterium]|nr:nucleotidyltransferase family protein [bacterium]
MENICCIILAAGRSERFGGNKILLTIEGETFLDIILRKLRKMNVEPIVIYHYPEIRDAVGTEIRTVHNPHPETGQLDSIRAGVKALPDNCDGFVLWPADMPLIKLQTVKKMLITAAENPHNIIAPSFKGSLGHPALFPRKYFAELFYDLERGAHTLVHSDRTVSYDSGDLFTKIGVNTKQHFRRYLDEYEKDTARSGR